MTGARVTLAWLPDGRTAAVVELPEGSTPEDAEKVRRDMDEVWKDGPILVLLGFGGVDVRVVQAEQGATEDGPFICWCGEIYGSKTVHVMEHG